MAKETEKKVELNNKKYKSYRSSLIFYLNTSIFFISMTFFLLINTNITNIFIYMIIISFVSYSASIILVSLLIKNDETIDMTDNYIMIENYINLSTAINNQINLFKLDKIIEKTKEEKIKLEIVDYIPKNNNKININTLKLKIEEEFYIYKMK